MSDAPPEAAPTPPNRRARLAWGRWQLGVRGLILLVVASALGAKIAVERRRIVAVTARIDQIRPAIRTLEVEDPTQFAVVSPEDPFAEGVRWDVYLPPGQRYRVALATREIADDDETFPAPLAVRELAPGRYQLQFVESSEAGRHGLVILDGRTRLLELADQPGWSPGWSGSRLDSRLMTQQPTDRPLQLLRRRYYADPSQGVLIWVEAVPGGGSDPAPAPGPGR